MSSTTSFLSYLWNTCTTLLSQQAVNAEKVKEQIFIKVRLLHVFLNEINLAVASSMVDLVALFALNNGFSIVSIQ